MKKITVQFECDICKRKSKANEDTTKWLEWDEECVIDRTWIEHCMCPDCLDDIKIAIKHKSSKQ